MTTEEKGADAPEAKKPEETKVTQLAANRVVSAEIARNVWHANPEAGTPADAVLDPKYWVHYAVNQSINIRPGDRIEAYPEDGAYYLELIVRSTFRGGIVVKKLRFVEFGAAEEQQADDLGEFEVKWSGNRLKWSVYRKADKQRLTDGHENKELAYDWVRGHQKALAA